MNTFDLQTPVQELQRSLEEKRWLSPKEQILSLAKPGEGNMNVVIRVITDKRSFILKQSRPYVEKYQQIKAPIDRIAVEQEFYKVLQGAEITAHMPRVLGYDVQEHLLMLQDLGDCQDMTMVYDQRKVLDQQLELLISILSLIHRTKAPTNFPKNMDMRRLNHQHIFVLPFLEDNGFDLDSIQPGLNELSLPYKKDVALKEIIEGVGMCYLSPGSTLLHGDYYPGSWMVEGQNIYVIDPEFGFVGFAEFDVGVMAAHLIMATMDKNYLTTLNSKYTGTLNRSLVAKISGIEIMRRLIGLAQLSLTRTIEEKDYLLTSAYEMIMR